MSEHAMLSPSGSARWLACPGSIHLSRRAPPQPESNAANEGTDAHDWAAKILLGGSAEDNPYAGIEMYVDRVRASAERKHSQVWIEKRVYLTDEVHGTPDAVVSNKNHLEVFDLKYGYNKVEARGNTQLIIYAGAAIKTYKLNPRRVTLHIVQPRAGGVRSATMTRKMFDAALSAVLLGAERVINDLHVPLHAGEHCQYCPAATICPERQEEAKLAAQMAFRDVEDLDDSTTTWVLENKKRITDWFDEVIALAVLKPPIGWVTVQGQGRRVWRTDIEVPMMLKAMTLAEATKAGHNIDKLTVKRAGPLIVVRKDFDASAFPEA